MSNYSIREENTLLGFSEAAQFLYLKLIDAFEGDEIRAFFNACRFEKGVGNTLHRVFEDYPGFADVPPKVKSELSAFFAERYRHNFMEKSNVSHEGTARSHREGDGNVANIRRSRDEARPE